MTIELPMSPDEAKQYSPHVLVLCRPRPYGSPTNYKFATEKEWRKPPTFDSPVDFRGQKNFIYAELLGIWIYDLNSGEIMAKYKPLFEYDDRSIGFHKGKKQRRGIGVVIQQIFFGGTGYREWTLAPKFLKSRLR